MELTTIETTITEKSIEIISVLKNIGFAMLIVAIIEIALCYYIGCKARNRVNKGENLPKDSYPCFYCGSHDLKIQCLMGKYNVVCRNCNTDYPGFDTLEEAIKDWNGED